MKKLSAALLAALTLWSSLAYATPTGPTVAVGSVKFFPNSAAPCKSGDNCLWLDSGTPNVIKFRLTGGTDTSLGAGGGGGTTQTIDVINATAATGKTITAAAANSGTNVGVTFNNSTALTGTTALASWQNNGTEQLRFGADGSVKVGGNFTVQGLASPNSQIVLDANVTLNAASGVIHPFSDGTQHLGYSTVGRWLGVNSYWYYVKLGSQLTAAASITPVTGLHHVTGATTITTISATNVVENGTVTFIADGGTITFSTGGNIAAAVTIAQNKAQKFVYDLAVTTWYPVQ